MESQRHLVAVIGSSKYKREYVQNKIDELINKKKVLSMIAKAEPQGAYSCFITAFKHKPSHIMRTVSNILDQMTAAACNLQCLTRMLRNNLYFNLHKTVLYKKS